jgi:hypothetical protein
MAGRPPKVKEEITTTDVVVENKIEETIVIDKEKEELKRKNDELSDLLLKLQAQVTMLATSGIPQQKENSLVGKKIKCINLMHNPLNVSTEPLGRGKVFEFQKYGDTKLIKFDELSDIVSSYPNTMEQGLLYIANPEAVEELGLSDEYVDVVPKDLLDTLLYLRRDMDVDVFVSLSKDMQESMAVEIAKLINLNEEIDLNRLKRIKDATGIDIDAISKAIKTEKELDK